MSPDSENVKARFLFAILRQMNLRDVDWDAVANDPYLLKDIPNGHAARMQYSRFRSTILGTEPQKRSTSRSSDKGRVTKPKKTSLSKNDALVKSESASSLCSYLQAHKSISHHIKQEACPGIDLSKLSPATFPSPCLGDSKEDFDSRFLTPCSDDMAPAMTAQHNVCHESTAFDPDLLHSLPDFMTAVGAGDHDAVAQSASFSNFDAAYDPLLDCGIDWNERYQQQNQF